MRVGNIVKRAEGRNQHRPPLCHRLQERAVTVQGETVFDGIDAGLHGQPNSSQTLGVGGDALPHAVGLIDDSADLGRCHLGRLRILQHHRAGTGRHDLDVIGPTPQLLAHRFSYLIGSVGLPVRAAEDRAPG